ncbi:MAG TPA: hypothetical protein VI299_28295 [Polyangiales bacterium]
MTDHRGSKQAVWDDESDADRPTNPAISLEELARAAAPNEDDAPTETDLDGAIELLRMSIPPAEVESAGDGTVGTMSREAVESVARFISDPGRVAQNTQRQLDAPSRTLAALELLEGPEYGAEPTDVRLPPQPPPPPGSIRPPEDLPTMLLGASMSTRNDPTERTQAIPLTHPLANSIAPGGSTVSTPPRARRSNRWQVALGVAVLMIIGVGASRFLSQGEHHAASGLPGDDEAKEPVETRREEPAVADVIPPQEQTAPSEQELAAQQVAAAEAAREAEAQAARAAETAPKPARVAPVRPVAVEPAVVAKEKPLRVGIGGVRMLRRDERGGEVEAVDSPDRAQVIAAMNAMTEVLKDCVGDEHGVADVTLTVRGEGVVSHALVEGAFAGSPQGSCIARALRTAKLPAFAEPVTHIEYPFQL